jgi:hypothetical protein
VTPSPLRAFRCLAREAVADATRRRIVGVIAGMAILSLFFVDSCTSCSPTVVQNGRQVQLSQVAGYGGLALGVVLGLWTIVLAGVLAADHLAEPLADGSAQLVLARPVSRTVFGLARLAGALVLALATGAVLLGGTAVLLQARQGLALGPAVVAWLACALGSTTVAALAMTASLALPRTATALLVVGGVWGLAGLELAAQLGAKLEGVPGLLVHAGPPLAASLASAFGPWIAPTATQGEPLALAARSLAWALASTGALVVALRRADLGG